MLILVYFILFAKRHWHEDRAKAEKKYFLLFKPLPPCFSTWKEWTKLQGSMMQLPGASFYSKSLKTVLYLTWIYCRGVCKGLHEFEHREQYSRDSSWWWWWWCSLLDFSSAWVHVVTDSERHSCFPGLCPAWDCCSFPITVGSVQYLSWRGTITGGSGSRNMDSCSGSMHVHCYK